jgi:hypothetical protein
MRATYPAYFIVPYLITSIISLLSEEWNPEIKALSMQLYELPATPSLLDMNYSPLTPLICTPSKIHYTNKNHNNMSLCF